MVKPAIVGRANEVSAVDRFLADEAQEPRALLIEGEPGIGKTTLFKELLEMARERGHRILSCRPARSEMDLSYAGLVETLGGLDDQFVRGLPAPQARILNMILRREEPEGAFDRLSLSVAVLAAFRAVASAGPLLVAVDDVQWLDGPTVRTFAFVARRLAGTSTRIAVVRRNDGEEGWPLELEHALPEGRLDSIRLATVSPSELSRIIRRTLGWAPAWPRMLRIAELSGGNPFYALEVTRAVGGSRSDEDLEVLLPGSVVDLARSRIGKLPARVRDALELASVSRSPTIDLLQRLTPADADVRGTLAAAERARIITVDEDRIRFDHPILAAAVYGSVPRSRRQELHRAVALLCDDLEERARHLAAASQDPDTEVAVILEGAAEQAWRRGAPDAAANLLRMSCRLTPETEADALALRRIALGRILYQAGDVPGATAELEDVAAALPPGPIRARALFHLMYVTRASVSLGRSVEYGLQAAREARDDPPFQSEAYELLSRLADNDIALKLETARRAVESIDSAEDPDPEVRFYATAAMVEAEFLAGLGIHLERLEHFPPDVRLRFPPIRTASRADDLIGRLLAYSGRIDEGLAVLQGVYDRASVENRSLLPGVLVWIGEAEILTGRFEVALARIEEADERAAEIGNPIGLHPWGLGFLGIALARLGRLDDAEAAASRALRMAEEDPSVGLDQSPGLLAMGLVTMARGQFDRAVTYLQALDRLKREAGIREPLYVGHAGELVEALVGSGDLDAAAGALATLEEDAERSGGPWSRAVAARSAALLAAARSDLDGALEQAERSVRWLETYPAPFERARAVLLKGQVLRRRKEKRLAREALENALETFEVLGTPMWAGRARAELGRISGRRSTATLTPTEETVARLAASGLSNREIADRAFLSPKTVEVNLTRIYRKLDVHSRAALRDRLAAGHEARQT